MGRIGLNGSKKVEDKFSEINSLGSRLSLEVHCAIRFPAHDKNMFVCEHGKTFPLFRLQGSQDWSWTRKEHEEWVRGVGA